MKNVHSIEIDAPPASVFAWLGDGERAKQWVPNLVESEDIVRTPDVVGSTFRHVYLERGRRMEMHGKVVGYEPPRRFTLTLSGPFDAHVDYVLDDIGGGRTRLTQHSEVRFRSRVMAVIAALLSPLMKGAASKQAEQSFGKLRRLIETG